MQYFYINKDSVLPYLRIEMAYDGRFDFMKSSTMYKSLQNAKVTFTMWDENDRLRISEAECDLIDDGKESCENRIVIQYKWTKRDTKEKGQFKGQFKISFNGDIKEEGIVFPEGDLIVPIYEDLTIMIK